MLKQLSKKDIIQPNNKYPIKKELIMMIIESPHKKNIFFWSFFSTICLLKTLMTVPRNENDINTKKRIMLKAK